MSNVDELKRRVIDEVEASREALVRIADTIYANPEIAFEEFESAALLSGTLEENGFSVERGVAGLETAFVATLRGKASNPQVAFLAEYDALPNLGHACGHNLIGTAAVGAGVAMKAVLPELAGTVQVIGTPAEERGGGKVIMVKAGVFESVDAAMMVHPSNRNMTRRKSLTSHKVSVKFFGKASHAAASPDQGINALDAVIQTFNGINALRQHLRDDARIHGIITHGGRATNIVPDYAAAQFGVRAADVSYAMQVIEKVRACAEAGALATGARLEFKENDTYYENMMPNPKMADLVDANMAALGIKVRLPSPGERMGSSDMGNVSQVVPALHPYITIGPEELMGHTVEFREAAGSAVGHESMINAAKLMAMTAVDLLAVPANMVEAKRAFQEQKKFQAQQNRYQERFSTTD
jgi:amidohydrolase